MRRIVDFAISHARLTLAILIFLLAAGALAYINIPKEANPDVTIPIIYVQLSARGISPEDAERLLVRPMETALKSVGNVKQMRSAGFEGGGYVLLEFEAGFNSDVALAGRARQGRRRASANCPPTPTSRACTKSTSASSRSIIVTLSGDLSERALGTIARQAQDAIEQVPGVLSADASRARATRSSRSSPSRCC